MGFLRRTERTTGGKSRSIEAAPNQQLIDAKTTDELLMVLKCYGKVRLVFSDYKRKFYSFIKFQTPGFISVETTSDYFDEPNDAMVDLKAKVLKTLSEFKS